MISKTKNKKVTILNIYNLPLIIMASFLLLIYVLLANYAFSAQYRLSLLKRQSDKLSIEVANLQKSIDEASDIISLRSYAIQAGLVEARDAYVITKDNDFALKDK